MLERRVGEPFFGHHAVELVVAQVGDHVHALQFGFRAFEFQRGFVDGDVQRHGRVGAAFVQRVGLHHVVGQHGDLVARHVHRGQARAAELVDGAARLDGQTRRGDVDAQHHGARAQALHRQRIVDFGGLRVIDGIRLRGGQRQLVRNGGCGDGGKACALGEVLEQEALPVELVGRIDGARLLQQVERRGVRGAAGVHHGLVLGRVLVGLEQDLVELVADGLRAFAPSQRGGPFVDLREDGLFLLDGGQRLLQDLGRCLLEPALARTAEVVRGVVQAEQRTGLLGQGGVFREIVPRQVGKAELVFGRELPGQVQLNGFGHGLGLGDQVGRRGFLEFQEDVGGLDLDPLARVELNLGGCIGFGQDTTGHELAGFFKQCVHGWHCPMGAAPVRRPRACPYDPGLCTMARFFRHVF
ncbi:hypothetical protein D3C71_1129030 [compost metagenome]